MNSPVTNEPIPAIAAPSAPSSAKREWLLQLGQAIAAALVFNVALTWAPAWPLVTVYLGLLVHLSRAGTSRRAFYLAWFCGFLVFATQTAFLWNVFGGLAVLLWAVVGAWHGIFAASLRAVRQRWGECISWFAAPILWMAQEFVRSEWNPLKFSWLAAGGVIPVPTGSGILHWLGLYGTGATLMVLAVFSVAAWRTWRGPNPVRWPALTAIGAAVALLAADHFRATPQGTPRPVSVAGVQLEFPGAPEVLQALDDLLRKYPRTELILLSEYTFDGPVPEIVRNWCRKNRRWLVAGGKAPIDKTYRNTAFVIDPSGEVVFEQAKSVPIQFFNDGLPAESQEIWKSPWGPIGIGICYDASYSRVMDRLVQKGAACLLVPTMDVEHWGAHEHELNARMSIIRAAEYGLPVFRVASSGISMIIQPRGNVGAKAPFPGPGKSIEGTLLLELQANGLGRAHLPLDRWPARVAVFVSLVLIGCTLVSRRTAGTSAMTVANPFPNSQ